MPSAGVGDAKSLLSMVVDSSGGDDEVVVGDGATTAVVSKRCGCGVSMIVVF